MEIDLDKLRRVAELMHQSQSPASEPDNEWMKQWIVACSKLEATGHKYAKHAPRLRRRLASQLLADEIVAGTKLN